MDIIVWGLIAAWTLVAVGMVAALGGDRDEEESRAIGQGVLVVAAGLFALCVAGAVISWTLRLTWP